MQALKKFNLKQLLTEVVAVQKDINQIYLFGSRAYRTVSLRSDCDLLVRVSDSGNVRASDLRDFAMAECPALDFFIATGSRAISCMNDSFVMASTIDELVAKLDAVLLWSRVEGFSGFEFDFEAKWVFSIASDVVHKASVLPGGQISEPGWQTMIKRVEQEGLPTRPFIGDTIDKATAQIVDIIQKMVMRPIDLGQRGKAKNGWTVHLADEYDCQNLFYTVVKPWLPRLEREEVELIYDKQKKISDFSLFEGKLIIEFKFIDSDAKKREIVKDLEGLRRFYLRNANVKCLLMVIFVRSSVSLDRTKWEDDYTIFANSPRVMTKVVRLPYG